MTLRTLGLCVPSYNRLDNVGSRNAGTRRTKSQWYPTFLALAVGGLNGGSRIYDAPALNDTREHTLELASKFDFVVFHPSDGSLANELAFIKELKAVQPGILTAMAGPTAVVRNREILDQDPFIDAVFVEEYDTIVPEVAEKGGFENVKGVMYRKGADIVVNDHRDKPDINGLPWVSKVYARDLEIPRYYLPFVTRPYIQLYSSRGCTSRCWFCNFPQIYTNSYATGKNFGVRFRSVEDTLAEIQWIKDNLKFVKEVFIDDDTYTDIVNIKSGRFKEMTEGLGRIGLPYSVNVRADASRETLETLRNNGARLCVTGFESHNGDVLRKMKKGTSPAQQSEYVKNVRELGLLLHACIICGNVGETWDSINETIDWLKTVGPSCVQVAPLAGLRGTELYNEGLKTGLISTLPLFDTKGRQLTNLRQKDFSPQDVEKAVNKTLLMVLFSHKFILTQLRDSFRSGAERERIWRNVTEFTKDAVERWRDSHFGDAR